MNHGRNGKWVELREYRDSSGKRAVSNQEKIATRLVGQAEDKDFLHPETGSRNLKQQHASNLTSYLLAIYFIVFRIARRNSANEMCAKVIRAGPNQNTVECRLPMWRTPWVLRVRRETFYCSNYSYERLKPSLEHETTEKCEKSSTRTQNTEHSRRRRKIRMILRNQSLPITAPVTCISHKGRNSVDAESRSYSRTERRYKTDRIRTKVAESPSVGEGGGEPMLMSSECQHQCSLGSRGKSPFAFEDSRTLKRPHNFREHCNRNRKSDRSCKNTFRYIAFHSESHMGQVSVWRFTKDFQQKTEPTTKTSLKN